jgi:peptide/nickel transport system ATP-binding protein
MNYAGKSITAMSKSERVSFRREVQAIFQDPFSIFNPFYPVDHLLEMPLRIFKIARNRAEERDMIDAALQRVGLRPEQVLGRHPHQLSGGQRQRIVVARSLMLRPRLIVADEPVSMIDASLRANVLSQIQALRDDLGISIIYITHDIATARQVSDEVFVLNKGRTVESGTAAAVISNPQHPYTRLLVGSVPRPDPDHGWSDLSEQLEDQS